MFFGSRPGSSGAGPGGQGWGGWQTGSGQEVTPGGPMSPNQWGNNNNPQPGGYMKNPNWTPGSTGSRFQNSDGSPLAAGGTHPSMTGGGGIGIDPLQGGITSGHQGMQTGPPQQPQWGQQYGWDGSGQWDGQGQQQLGGQGGQQSPGGAQQWGQQYGNWQNQNQPQQNGQFAPQLMNQMYGGR